MAWYMKPRSNSTPCLVKSMAASSSVHVYFVVDDEVDDEQCEQCDQVEKVLAVVLLEESFSACRRLAPCW